MTNARRAFLLGSGSGFVLHLPVARNRRDRVLHDSKWFGASGFGRQYLSALRLWLVREGEEVALDRSNQIGFRQEQVEAVREYEVAGTRVRETLFVAAGSEALVVRVEADGHGHIIAEPQFDMRYYQAFNSDFSTYRATHDAQGGISRLSVTNSIPPPAPGLTRLEFAVEVSAIGQDAEIVFLLEGERLRRKTYLVDEMREKVVHAAAQETHVEAPDEAPIWDQYETTVFPPARIVGESPLELQFGFGSTKDEATAAQETVRAGSVGLRRRRRENVQARLDHAGIVTGESEVDAAYGQVLNRFDQCLVARNMVVRTGQGQPDTQTSAILAGDKYFLDPWKRDENIALGALLATGDFETARAILDDSWRFQDTRTGRLPQIIRLGEKLVYYSSDGTLWALRRLDQYTRVSGDRSLLETKYPLVERFFEASLDFVQRGLLPSGGIVDPSYLWETWMDTPYTPRDGYPVEIELLWLTNLAAFAPLVSERNADLAGRMREAWSVGRETFRGFYLDGYLADSLDHKFQPRDLLTPNGYIAFGLDFPLPEDLACRMVILGREQLAGRVGIRGLAPRDWPRVLSPEFMADRRNFDGPNMASVGIYNYHRGVEWLWLNQFFVRGELRYGNPDTAFDRYLSGQVHSALHEGGVGGLSELHDIHGPLGADFQAWSMAGFVESLRAFAGTDVDATAGTVEICPALPRRWSALRWQTRIGDCWLSMQYERADDGGQTVEIASADGRAEGITPRVQLPDLGAGARRDITFDGRPVGASVYH